MDFSQKSESNNNLIVYDHKLSNICNELLDTLESIDKLDKNQLDEKIKNLREKVIEIYNEF